jgi:hypothetical protein
VRYQNTDRFVPPDEARVPYVAGSLASRQLSVLDLLSSYCSPLWIGFRKELNVSRIYWDFISAP